MYNFKPSESFYSRPFGLVVNIYYRDLVCGAYCVCVCLCPYCSLVQDGNQFVDAVFNNTVNIVELEEGFDAETYAVTIPVPK